MYDSVRDTERSTFSQEVAPAVLHGAQNYLECLRRQQAPAPADLQAWAQFYLVCDPLLRRFARACRVYAEDVDDCVQSSWKKITASLPDFDYRGEPGRLAAWLHSVVHSKVTDLRRYRVRHPTCCLTAHLGVEQKSRDADPAARLERRRHRPRVRRVLAELRCRVSATSYRAFRLRWIEGRSAKEVSRLLRLSVTQVR
jgi:RNA polymerase sigma factor (sigma-70 family)